MRSITGAFSIPNPTPVLFLLAAALAWSFFVLQNSMLTGVLLFVLGAGLVLPIAVSALVPRPATGMVLLFVASVMPRYSLNIFGLNARPEHLVIGLLLLVLPFWLHRRGEPFHWIVADSLLMAYMAMHLFSSLFMSIAPGQTLRWAMQQLVVILAYLLIRSFVTDRSSFQKLFHVALLVGAIEATYAILCFYSNLIFDTEFGMEVGQYGSIPGTYGSLYEANILGSYCGAACCMFLTMYLRQRKRIFLRGFALTLAGMGISLSRGALAGTLIALAIFVLLNWKQFDRQILMATSGAVLAVALVVAPAVLSSWFERFSTVEVSNVVADDNTRVRVLTIGLATEGILEHPVAGNGTASYQLQFSAADLGGGDEAGWIGNTEMRILYDTGAIGLAIFVAFLGSLFVGARRILRREPVPEMAGLLVASLVYCVSFQFTEGTLLGFSWLHLGLIAAGVAVYQQGNQLHSPAGTQTEVEKS
jgi:O-antigen ligase/polysaccharide polymerase Wzy-like membrane protein